MCIYAEKENGLNILLEIMYLHMDSPTKIILQIMDFWDTIWDIKEENRL